MPKTYFLRAERLVKEHKKAVRNDIRLQREEKKPTKCQLKPNGNLAFVLRIRGYVIQFTQLKIWHMKI